jgi:hypothetical protein
MSTEIPELGRLKKAGLQRSAHPPVGAGFGTPAPGEGYALTISERECEKLTFEHHQDEHDVIIGVGLVAAKRASLIGRGPTLGDVHVALDYFGLRQESPIPRASTALFRGLAHSYVAQRRFVDAVPGESLTSGANDAASSH